MGVSVDSGSAAAKNIADMVLRQKSLKFLETTVLAGRRSFVNMIKYIRMGASSNWGNMFSVVGASLSLPFIPMLPLQVVLSNLLYDFAQLGVPTDTVDMAQIQKPQVWNTASLQRFIVCLGFMSSVFDFITFYLLYFYVGGDQDEKVFHTGWFIEGLLSQTLIVFVLRRTSHRLGASAGWKHYFGLDTPPSTLLILASSLVCTSGILITQLQGSQAYLGFTDLPDVYWFYLVAILVGYLVLTGILLPHIDTRPRLYKAQNFAKVV